MSLDRLLFVRNVTKVRALVFKDVAEKIYDWTNPGEPVDMYVCISSEYHGPRDWSPRKKKKQEEIVLGEVDDLDRIGIFIHQADEGETLWNFDPSVLQGFLVLLPVLRKIPV